MLATGKGIRKRTPGPNRRSIRFEGPGDDSLPRLAQQVEREMQIVNRQQPVSGEFTRDDQVP